MLKYILLGFLSYGQLSGYDIKRLIDLSTKHFWHAYHSQIYTTLRKMEKDGLVASEIDDGDDKLNRRIYTITEAGQAKVTAWLNEPMTDLEPTKNELMVRIFFSGLRDKETVLNELKLQRQLHQQRLDKYQQYAAERLGDASMQVDADSVHYWGLTLKYGRAYEEHLIRWLDETIADLSAT